MTNQQEKWAYALFQAKESDHFFIYLLPFSFWFQQSPEGRAGETPPPVGLLKIHMAELSFSTSAPPKMHTQQNPHSALKLRAEPGIMLLWCDIFAVLSASITRTGPQGVGSTLRPAAFVSPRLFYSITEKIAIAFSSKYGGNRYLRLSVYRGFVSRSEDVFDSCKAISSYYCAPYLL